MSSASWVNQLLFWIVALFGIPLGVLASRVYRPVIYLLFALLLFSTFDQGWSITFMSRESYKAATRGFEVHLSDLMSLTLLGAMLYRPSEFRLNFFPPLTGLFLAFFCWGLISWVVGEDRVFENFEQHLTLENLPSFEPALYPLFELSKILRGILLYIVVYNFCQDRYCIRVMNASFGAVILVVTFWGLLSRYGYGEHRIQVGSFHVNDLNSYIGLLGLFLYPFAFSTKTLPRSLAYWGLTVLGFLVIVLTVSRSSLAGYVLGGFVATCFCLVRFPSWRNVTLVLLSCLMGLFVMVKASDTLLERFIKLESTAGAFDVRENLNAEAVLMADDHFFGVGLGNFSTYAIKQYAEKSFAERYNIAHNVFYLTLAELGYVGLAIYLLMWLRVTYLLLKGMFFSRWSLIAPAYVALVGTLSAIILLQFQNCFHFSYRQTSVYFATHILLAVGMRSWIVIRNDVRKKTNNRSFLLRWVARESEPLPVRSISDPLD